jgi:hypothetical protein
VLAALFLNVPIPNTPATKWKRPGKDADKLLDLAEHGHLGKTRSYRKIQKSGKGFAVST